MVNWFQPSDSTILLKKGAVINIQKVGVILTSMMLLTVPVQAEEVKTVSQRPAVTIKKDEIKPLTSKYEIVSIIRSQSLSDWLFDLRDCESHGNYKINNGNGYYGAYQFSKSTWDSWNTGYAYAHLAPPEVQDQTIIKNTIRSAGLKTQNPGCYVKKNLSNKPPEA